ncbi:alpha/beta hydrolase [Crateriforma conspicua]|uniref:alpha/beta hydrolase n=1 Tax=Crateriforma conspicua TaxID=2527996 RepID=UPI00118B1C58|nr:alpha/beta hydrolase [Crateriforma conspicua]QDV60888.1 Carboxylesterase NlhH [Crateriforma conspicua]
MRSIPHSSQDPSLAAKPAAAFGWIGFGAVAITTFSLVTGFVIGLLSTASARADTPDNGNNTTTEPAVQAGAEEMAEPGGDVIRKFDVVYDPETGRAGKCDIYLPAPADIAPVNPGSPDPSPKTNDRPAVVVVHGGGWMSGDKWTMYSHCNALAKRGHVVISINYRLAPEHKFPAQVDDVRKALLWLDDHASELNVDLNRVGLFGYSAGGHLSALVAVVADESPEIRQRSSDWAVDDARWDRLPKIKAVCAGGPPCDFRELPPENTSLAYFLGGSRRQVPEIYRAASPTALASTGDPPIHIIHGGDDFLVPVTTSRSFVAALRDQGVECQLTELPKLGHLMTFMDQRTKQTMIRWFEKML